MRMAGQGKVRLIQRHGAAGVDLAALPEAGP